VPKANTTPWWPNCWRAWPTGAEVPGGEVGTIDGLRVDFADGFGLIRGSNTTPVLVLRFEGHTPEALHRIEAQFMAALRSVKPDAQVTAAAH
jgi:phosphomannomutase